MGCRATRALILSPLLVAACTVGPDFERPAAPDVGSYDSATLPQAERVAEHAQAVDFAQSVPARWWDLFHSPALDETLRLVFADNKTLAAARATWAQSQQAVLVARAPFLPQLDLAANTQRSGSLASSATPVTRSYSIGPSVTYTLDVFGLTGRTVEQQEALAESQHYQLAAAYLTLTGGAATEAIAIAAARLQIATLEDVLASDQQNLDLVRHKFDVGKAAETDVLTAESQLLGDRSQISALRQQLSVARHALAVLASRSPAEWLPPEFDLAEFALPTDLPASVPSALVRQRPDILSAEAQLHAASAAIGVATAQQYPTITLTAALTQQSLSAGTLFEGANNLWSLGAGLTAPIFHGGALEAQKQAAVDAFDAQLATYQQTIVQAFGQVADALRALDHDAEFVANARQALTVSETSLKLERANYQVGKASILDLIVAERAYAQSRLSFVAAEIQQLQDTVQFFVVMGGGWWNAAEL
jgi:NodT family efflux transporter outer membrane factor (OMF) lipoprotein